MMHPKSNKESKIKTKGHSQDSIPSFIRKTYDILEERKFPEVIDWNPEGTAIVIKRPTEFCQKVLPTYFKHNNLTSFVRQLNMYNFHKRRTQNLDHVYFHELFQRGKKHLLKDIRRKTQNDHASEKAQKAMEASEASQSGKDYSSLSYENQMLKRLYNDAMTKIAMLENQIKDMTIESRSLWSQLCQKNEDDSARSRAIRRGPELPLEQTPIKMNGINIPPLKLENDHQIHNISVVPSTTKISSVNCYLNFNEETGESTATEISRNSPSIQRPAEGEKTSESYEVNAALQLPQLSPTPQAAQIHKPQTDLLVKQEMSVGQLFEAWGADNFTNETVSTDKSSILGKRPLELDSNGFQVPEPPMKMHDLSVFNRKSLISTGIEEKDILRNFIRRDSSLNEEYDHNNAGVDLMDFNHPFFSWAKTA